MIHVISHTHLLMQHLFCARNNQLVAQKTLYNEGTKKGRVF